MAAKVKSKAVEARSQAVMSSVWTEVKAAARHVVLPMAV